jgi:phosphomannomutase
MSLFGTAGIRGPVRETVTPELALAVGRAAGRDGEEFVVARDGRETGTALVDALVAGIASAGADVRRAGQLPTPGLAFASRGRRGVMVTASHNPPADNGIKLFVDGIEYDREAERRVEERVAAEAGPAEWDAWGDSESVDVLSAYRDHVADYARSAIGGGVPDDRGDTEADRPVPLGGVRVAVDCGNGMGAVATPQVLTELGASVEALNANVDGHFPARESKPTPETLEDVRRYVADAGDFEMGIAHDGDADRVVVLDAAGEVVHEDTVLAILAEHFVRTSEAGDPVVVTTPNASARIDDRVEAAGGRVERVRLGALHEGIASARAAGGPDTEVAFAGEPWKHVHPRSGGWIDGVASAATVAGLAARAGGLEPLREPVAERPYRKVSVECPDDRKTTAMERLERTLPERFDGDVDTEYGVRIDMADGSWVLVRPSGTEPYVRVYAESDAVDELVGRAVDAVEAAIERAGERS